jgi:hypothetical protein
MARLGIRRRAMHTCSLCSATLAAVILVIAGAGLAGCKPVGDNSVPAPKVTQAPATSVAPPASPDTTPKASDVFKDGAPVGKASTNQQQADPSHTLTKQEESTSMPMAGQANDHSTLAKDPTKR